MAEEFEGGVIGGNWAWNSSRNLFGSSPCSLATNDRGSFGWSNHDVMEMELKAAARSSDHDFEMMVLSSTPPDHNWNQDLLNDSGRSEQNYSNFLMNSNMNYQHQSSKVDDDSSSSSSFDSSLSLINTTTSIHNPLNSASYNSLLQTLFDTDSPQQSLLDYSTNYHPNSNGFLPKHSPMLNQQPSNHYPNAPLWNSNLPSTNFTQSLPSSLSNKRPNHPSFGGKHQHDEQGKQSGSVTKKEAAFKRPRIETPSPLPTFKVRKEKLGDRITALQQLVSPFGKTDTASVLHEAIEYIKFLHDQVNALSTPYLKYGSPPLQRQQGGDKAKDGEGLIKDLNSRGLCLVPISSTFPVASETPSDFWTPTFGGN